MRKIPIIAGVVAAAALTLTACGSSAPPTFTSKGSIELYSESGPVGDPLDGAQVLILDPSGKIITAAPLTFSYSGTGLVSGTFYSFTVKVPTGLSEYGIQVPNQGPASIVWETEAQMRSGPALEAEDDAGVG
jgi:hypothetical protein